MVGSGATAGACLGLAWKVCAPVRIKMNSRSLVVNFIGDNSGLVTAAFYMVPYACATPDSSSNATLLRHRRHRGNPVPARAPRGQLATRGQDVASARATNERVYAFRFENGFE